jgi:tetratricopeptide (TPR) repeat protein
VSPKAVGILVVIIAVVGGLVWFRRAPAPGLPVEVAAQVEKDAKPAAEPLALPQARRSANRAERASDSGFKEQFAQIDALIRAGNPQEALKMLEEILAKNPNHERALEEMGMLYLTEFQDQDKATGFFKRALTVNPNNEFAVMELVGISLAPDKASATVDYLKSLYDANPNSPVLSDGLGELYLTQGKFAEAVTFLERSAQTSKYAEFAYTRLGSVYEQMGDTDKAADYYKKAITHQSTEMDKRRNEGQSTELLEADRARSQLDLAHLLVKERKYEEALEHLEQARRRLGNDWEVQALAEQIRRESGAG